MSKVTKKVKQAERRRFRVKSQIHGTKEKPRLRVFVSNKHVSAQVIDDDAHSTIVSSTTVGKKTLKGSMTEKAAWVGSDISKKASTKKVKVVVFDRGSKLYHGRVKALADAAREGGLEF